MSEAALSVRRAHKRHGKRGALCGLDIELAAGEWVALLGPNGAGKTTLMRSIAGTCGLDSGELAVGGLPVGPATRSLVGLVPQEIALYGPLTARENLEVFARWHGVSVPEIPERRDWALDWTGLAARAGERVDSFSGGMKRRLNIACGVLHRPKLVLLDEPTVGVDPQGRQRIWAMLETLRAGGAALLQSTHQLDEVEQSCDRLLIVDRGEIVISGTLDELVAQAGAGRRRVEFVLARPPAGGEIPAGLSVEGRRLRGSILDVASELPALLAELEARGFELRDLRVESPSLESVFTRLTGRELRE